MNETATDVLLSNFARYDANSVTKEYLDNRMDLLEARFKMWLTIAVALCVASGHAEDIFKFPVALGK
ncbi:hypothetical protein HXX76_008626 [Chlamydomonas incerta]|uniref:Uncharacterized protein n=1 Tax=Chlamydomonas incerta TaxID=51695 RepID=A0A835VYS0_CHLIN|nr:hypothetical protein HXX76_008626 [Chlamydomonas incerta]|eukprot:KAG2432895.1 hypothetical protein HXX76_008626 [Chlamydomonas incerta]